MLKKERLTVSEKERIVASLAEGLSLLDLAKELGRDQRTLSFSVKKKIKHDPHFYGSYGTFHRIDIQLFSYKKIDFNVIYTIL